MAAKIRSMGVMVEKAAESVIDGEVTDEQSFNCSLAKYYVPKTATEVADRPMLIFG